MKGQARFVEGWEKHEVAPSLHPRWWAQFENRNLSLGQKNVGRKKKKSKAKRVVSIANTNIRKTGTHAKL